MENKIAKIKNDILYISDTQAFTGYILKQNELDSQSLINIYTWALQTYLNKKDIYENNSIKFN